MSDIDEILRNIEAREKGLHESEKTLEKIRKAAKSGYATPTEQNALEAKASQLSDSVRREGATISNARALSEKREQLEKAKHVLQRGYFEHEENTPGTESYRTVQHKMGIFERARQKKAIQRIEQEAKGLEARR